MNMVSPIGSHLESLPIADVDIHDDFWSPRRDTVRTHTLDNVYSHLRETGRLENFRLAAGDTDGNYNGQFYNDSDVYKWVEAASYAAAANETPKIVERVGDVVALIDAAQQENGYLNTYFQVVEPGNKWTNLHMMHELYCAGHLFEAAVAHHRATGNDQLLDVACKFADHIDRQFGPNAQQGIPGHQEIELALVKLARETDDDRYLDLAQYFLDERGQPDSPFIQELQHADEIGGDVMDELLDDEGNYDGSYFQDHAPVREQDTVEGHAVRAMYLYTGMAEVVKETGEDGLLETLHRLWQNMTQKRMYVTGGIGSTYKGERFTADYDLPTETSYAETCAALGSILWNQRMFELTGKPQFGDLMDRTLHNALLAGLSLDGTEFFYANPHEMGPDGHPLHDINPNRFANERQGWFDTACCPTNIPRLVLSLNKFIYARDPDAPALYTNLFISSTATTSLNGTQIELTQDTSYPWVGETTFEVAVSQPTSFTLNIRIPEWAADPAVKVNRESVSASDADAGFVQVNRKWESGDTVTVTFQLPIMRLAAHPNVRATAGQIALQRGPIVYCLEGVDHDRPLHQLALPLASELKAVHNPDLLDGVTVLQGEAAAPALSEWADTLYQDVDDTTAVRTRIQAIPYYGWGHRDPGEMRIWMQTMTIPSGFDPGDE